MVVEIRVFKEYRLSSYSLLRVTRQPACVGSRNGLIRIRGMLRAFSLGPRFRNVFWTRQDALDPKDQHQRAISAIHRFFPETSAISNGM